MNGMQYLKNKMHLDELPFKRIFVVGSFKRFALEKFLLIQHSNLYSENVKKKVKNFKE